MIILQYKAISKIVELFKSWDKNFKLGPYANGSANKHFEMMKSNFIILVAIVFIFLFMFSIVTNEFIKINLSGMFGILLGSFTFFGGIISYVFYIFFLLFLRDLETISIEIPEVMPAFNQSLISLSRRLVEIEKLFLILGVFYSALYSILSFSKLTSLVNKTLQFDLPDNLFIITWILIICFFVIAYPILVTYSKYLLKQIIRSNKQKRINEYFVLIENRRKDSLEDIEKINQLLEMIDRIDKSKDTPLSKSDSWLNKIASFFSSGLSLVTPFITVYLESFINP